MNGYRVFTWDKDRFPNPEKMLNDLKEEGFKIIPIIDPGVKADSNYFAAKEGLAKNLFAKYPDGITYQGEVWPSWAYFPDFTNNNARDWWGEKLNMLLKQGVKGFWNDMNEPSVWGQAFPDLVMFDDNGFTATHKKIHNVYALEEAKATFDALQKYSPNERHFVLTRAGFAGIQRYAAVWTGDNVANEEHLKLACLMPQGLGLSGVSFVGSDVGGFIGIPSPRLYTRWMQIGAFTPFFRGHSALNQSDKEPWAFGGETENRVRDAISLRYKMLPFLYNEFHNSAITGLPIMRSMFLNYQDDDECYNDISQYQFMLGDNLLVAPVLSETSNYKTLYLPAGKWIDMRNQKIYNGKQWVTVDAPIEEIPFFLKQGGFIPLQETQQYVDEKKINQLEVIIFPASLPTPEGTGDQKNLRAGTSSYTLYEDDGISYNYRQGYYSLTEFTSTLTGNTGIINIYKTHNNYNPGRVYYLLKILNTQSVSKVTGNGRLLNRLMSESKLNDSEDGFYLDPLKNILFVKIKDVNDLEVKYDF
jgi:alpha-glucosidase